MSPYSIRPYTPADENALVELQTHYAAACPGVQVLNHAVYGHPAFAQGRNILLALDETGALLGYVALFPQPADAPAAQVVWAALRFDPAAGAPCSIGGVGLRAALLDAACARAREARSELSAGPARLTYEVLPTEGAVLEDLLGRGYSHRRTAHHLSRSLAEPLPFADVPEGLICRATRLESAGERQQYLAARNTAFAESPWTVESLSYLLSSPMWVDGLLCGAWDAQGGLVAGVLAYGEPPEARQAGRTAGYTEEVFVLPEWRRRGVATYLLVEALNHLQSRGLTEARMQVALDNEGALQVYRRIGYRELGRTLHVSVDL